MSEVLHIVKKILPKLEDDLISSKLPFTVEQYAKKILMQSIFIAVGLAFIGVLMKSVMIAIFGFLGGFIGGFFFFSNYPKSKIKKREAEINKNILFAGRYLLIKLEAGEPMFLSMIGVSKSYGEAGRAFNDIIQDINFGASIEEAVDRGVKYNPSKNLRKILWEISNSIKTGTDITRSLKAILEQISEEYLLEIEKYGKKLNSLILFYLVAAIIFPSLGLTMAVVGASFISVVVPKITFYIVAGMLVGIQVFFITLFRGARPAVNF